MQIMEADVCRCGIRAGCGFHGCPCGKEHVRKADHPCRAHSPSEDQIKVCREWLRATDAERGSWRGGWYPSLRRWFDSYTLKHAVERWCVKKGEHRYISNGAMIVAALREGSRVRESRIRGDGESSINCEVFVPRR